MAESSEPQVRTRVSLETNLAPLTTPPCLKIFGGEFRDKFQIWAVPLAHQLRTSEPSWLKDAPTTASLLLKTSEVYGSWTPNIRI